MAREFNPASSAPHPLHFGSASDIGRIRSENQDACLAAPELGLFLVSDGMGGQQAGALAAKVVVEMLPALIRRRWNTIQTARSRAVRYWLRHDILGLSRRLQRESFSQPGLRGMGATLVAILLRDGRAHIAHLGDSRAYLLRQGQLTSLTDAHSVVALLLRAGEITSEQAAIHPARGQLTRYIGMEAEVYPDVRTLAIESHDRLLLCSDGLTGMVSDGTIAEILNAHPDAQAGCHSLVDAANAAGGRDNVTVMIVNVG